MRLDCLIVNESSLRLTSCPPLESRTEVAAPSTWWTRHSVLSAPSTSNARCSLVRMYSSLPEVGNPRRTNAQSHKKCRTV